MLERRGARVVVFTTGILCGAILPVLLQYTKDPHCAHGLMQSLRGGFAPTATAAAPPAASDARVSSQCDLCADEFLFLLSPGGRSGSTTTLQMVNEIPGFDIMGENNGMVGTLREALASLNRTFSDSSYAWLHPKTGLEQVRAGALCEMQDFVKTHLLGIDKSDRHPNKTIGFKEVKHKTKEDLDFFRALFPCARYILTMRESVLLQYKSQKKLHWNFDRKNLEESRRNFEEFAAMLGPRLVFTLILESSSAQRFNEMLAWLGVTGCKFTSVLHANSHHDYNVQEGVNVIEGKCAYVHSSVPHQL